jgi:amidase/aspartyl-tRNA(Asn)/glutamyl-tRNA(Gln) amidotransferase subunit A
MTFSDWQRLLPTDAARLVRDKAEALPPAQHRAIFAMLHSEAQLEAAFTRKQASRISGRPLGGVPYVVKDVFDVEGVPTLAGSTFLNEMRPRPMEDGTLVANLREAGAVLTGKTHLHEFAYGITGENPHYGDVEHPGLPGRTSGGSSSGSAAAVAAGVVPLAFGTDTAGSIRVPAAFCGLFGFRMAPHHRWIADAFPLAPSFDTTGWFTANAGDMAVALHGLLGVKEWARPSRGAWLPFGNVDAELAAVQAGAAARLCGALEAAEPALAERLRAVFAEAPGAFAALRGPEAWAVHKGWAERFKDAYDPVVFARVIAGRDVTKEAQAAARKVQERLSAAFEAVWEKYDFLVLPATPCVAPTKAGCTQATRDRIFQVTTPVSVAGLPALTVPVMLPGGFSTGLQVVAPVASAPVFVEVLAGFNHSS